MSFFFCKRPASRPHLPLDPTGQILSPVFLRVESKNSFKLNYELLYLID